MTVRQYKTFQIGRCRGEYCVEKSWFTDVLYFLYAVLVTILSFTMIMEVQNPMYVGAVMIVAMFSILLLAKRNLQHFYIEWNGLRIGAAHEQEDKSQIEIEKEK